MNVQQFFNLTREVRQLQKAYFKTRDKETLQQCKAKEQALDQEIERVTKMGY